MSITIVKCITPIAPSAIVELKPDGVDEPAKASKLSIPDIATDWGTHAAMTRMSPRHHPKADSRHNHAIQNNCNASELHLTWIVTQV